MDKARYIVVTAMIFAAAVSRLLPHPPNFTPVAAMALFGGAYFSDKRLAFLIPLASLLLSDYFIGFYPHMEIVYGSFALTVCIGFWLSRRRTAIRILGAAAIGSLLFFFITNFGVWALGNLYPKTAEGLAACYAAAIPFYRATLLGDLCYAAILFGGFAWMEKRLPVLSQTAA